jgi:small-conductance mechanosensitive channel
MYDIKKIVPVIILTVIFVIGLPFVAVIMGSVDSGVDLTGTDYEEQYNATIDTSTTSISVMKVIPILFGVLVLILSIGALVVKKRSRRGY